MTKTPTPIPPAKPAAAKSAVTKPVVTKPAAAAKPAVVAKPASRKPAAPKPAAPKAAAAKAAPDTAKVSAPAPTTPAPAPAKAVEAKPVEAKPVETKVIETKPVDVKTADVKSVEAKSVVAQPVAVKSVEVQPVAPKAPVVKVAEVPVAVAKPAPAKPAAVALPFATFVPGEALPKAMQDLAETGLSQARDAYNKARISAETLTKSLGTSGEAATQGMQDFSRTVIDALQVNTDATLGFFKAMAGIRSVSEAVELQARHARAQFETVTEQAKTLAGIANRTVTQTAKPVREAFDSALRPQA